MRDVLDLNQRRKTAVTYSSNLKLRRIGEPFSIKGTYLWIGGAGFEPATYRL